MRTLTILRPRGARRPSLPTSVAVAAMLAFCAAAAGSSAAPRLSPAMQSQRAVELTDGAVALMGEGKNEEALADLDKAIAEDPEYWAAWYQRGRALALTQRYEEATEAFVRSTELNPGHANAHQLASTAARLAKNYEVAWDQAFRAYLAGAEAQQVFGALAAESEPPANYEERMNAARIYVAGVDTRELMSRAQGPENNRGGTARGIEGDLIEIRPDLLRLQRAVANAISSSNGFGLVQQPEGAQYVLAISPDEIDSTPRPSMSGYLRLYEVGSNEMVYSRQISFRDLSALGQVRSALDQVVNQMERWHREQG